MLSSTFINFNGSIRPASDPVFTVSNRAFRYGDGLFETMRMIRGELPLLDMHAHRLREGMKFLQMDHYQALGPERLREEIGSLCKSNKIFSNARVRISVFRDAAGLYTPSGNNFAFIVEMERIEEHQYELNKKGLLVDIYPDLRKDVNALSPFKTINSLPFVLSGIYRKKQRLDESVLLNTAGHICETTSSNIFLIKNGELYTPPLDSGCIDGVMRRVVIQVAGGAGIPVHETQLPPESLRMADEIFLTNAVGGIRWVVGYKDKRFYNRMSKSLNEALNAHIIQEWANSKL